MLYSYRKQNCHVYLFCSEISFQFIFNDGSCNTANNINEGVEFALRFEDEDMWIPLIYAYNRNGGVGSAIVIDIGNIDDLIIRGYRVKLEPVDYVNSNSENISIDICKFEASNIQLRWLQTSRITINNRNISIDLWSVDNINISYIHANGEKICLIEDSFDNDQLK